LERGAARRLQNPAIEEAEPMPTKKTTGASAKKKSTGTKKYSKKSGEKVERAMHEMKEGTLRSGASGKKVTSRKQAIAIGLSEARKEGAKVPKIKSS
jgi:hypothetical protein